MTQGHIAELEAGERSARGVKAIKELKGTAKGGALQDIVEAGSAKDAIRSEKANACGRLFEDVPISVNANTEVPTLVFSSHGEQGIQEVVVGFGVCKHGGFVRDLRGGHEGLFDADTCGQLLVTSSPFVDHAVELRSTFALPRTHHKISPTSREPVPHKDVVPALGSRNRVEHQGLKVFLRGQPFDTGLRRALEQPVQVEVEAVAVAVNDIGGVEHGVAAVDHVVIHRDSH
mmetsp:Transcript_28056/g.82169  ORF Transcript_28056/g.82169 Transcript_28056/m.82169 type:complete len:231 (+) Transcript_28056:191-883(+)